MLINTYKINNTESTTITIMKFILLLGVVLIHSSISQYVMEIPHSQSAMDLTDNLSYTMTAGCVPLFFVISGYLFFNNLHVFTLNIYLNKLKKRTRTLLIPYLLWCTFCLILLIIKYHILGYNGLGIISNEGIDWSAAIESYWSVPNNAYPVAFAFWFIRNLMIFCILSPIAMLIGKNIIIMIVFLAITVFANINLYGFNWYIIGCSLALNQVSLLPLSKLKVMISCIIFLLSTYFLQKYNTLVYNILMYGIVLSSLNIVVFVSSKLIKYYNRRAFHFFVNASFFIYAFHQCYISLLARILISIIGVSSFFRYTICYISEFILMILIALITYRILEYVCPKFLNIACGFRNPSIKPTNI